MDIKAAADLIEQCIRSYWPNIEFDVFELHDAVVVVKNHEHTVFHFREAPLYGEEFWIPICPAMIAAALEAAGAELSTRNGATIWTL